MQEIMGGQLLGGTSADKGSYDTSPWCLSVATVRTVVCGVAKAAKTLNPKP